MICAGNLPSFSYMPKHTTSFLSINLAIILKQVKASSKLVFIDVAVLRVNRPFILSALPFSDFHEGGRLQSWCFRIKNSGRRSSLQNAWLAADDTLTVFVEVKVRKVNLSSITPTIYVCFAVISLLNSTDVVVVYFKIVNTTSIPSWEETRCCSRYLIVR